MDKSIRKRIARYDTRDLLFPTYGLLARLVNFPKMPLCNPDFKIRIHVFLCYRVKI